MSTQFRRPLAPDVVLLLNASDDAVNFKLELKGTDPARPGGVREVQVDVEEVSSVIAFFALPFER